MHLKSQLQGITSEVLWALELTKVNYNIAIKLLKERCKRKQVMTDAQYTKIMNLFMAT